MLQIATLVPYLILVNYTAALCLRVALREIPGILHHWFRLSTGFLVKFLVLRDVMLWVPINQLFGNSSFLVLWLFL